MSRVSALRAAVPVVCRYTSIIERLTCRGPAPKTVRSLLLAASVVASILGLIPPMSASGQSQPQIATSATEGVFEDRVVVSWTAENVPAGAYLLVTRVGELDWLSGNLANGDTLAVRSRFDTEYSDFTGDPGATYVYNVAAKDGQDNTLAESAAAGNRVVFKPTNLRATLGTEEDRVLISWADRSEVETRYEIARGLEEDVVNGFPLTVLADLPENSASYSDTTAVPGTSYYYCATAYDAAGFTSQQVCDLGLRGFVTPPRDVSASDGQWPNFVRVRWTDASEAESLFTIYRIDFEGNVDSVGSVPANTTLFDDPFEGLLVDNDGLDNDGDGVIDEPGERVAIEYQYCVTATAGGMESVQVCDNGIRGILPAPANVAATVDTYDDRVVITWDDLTDTEDGFQIFRTVPAATDSVLLGKVGNSVKTFTDRTPLQDQDYRYCVRAFSAVATPDTTYSPGVCAPGRRTTVLAPTNVAATDNDFEERINVAWTNPATTAMFFNVYRDGVLIDNVSTATPFFTDFDAPSNRELNYCVTAVSIRGTAASQDVAAKMLDTAKLDAQAQAESSPQTLASVVFASVSEQLTAMSAASQSSAAAIVETAKVCDMGSRKLAAPTSITATYDEFEDHVQLSWTDNSNAERGYIIQRGPASPFDTTTPWVPIDTVSTDRTSHGDYTGTPGIEYGYRVFAFDMRGAAFGGGLSDPGTDTGFRKLEPPTAVQASDGTSETEVRITWIDNSRAETGYQIVKNNGGANIAVGSVAANATEFTEVGSALNVEYTYEVFAIDAMGPSESASDVGGTALLPPGDLNASDVYPDKVVIVWTDSSQVEDSYRVSRDGVPVEILAAGSTSFVDNSPGVGANEYCVDTVGPNAASNAQACTTGEATGPADTSLFQRLVAQGGHLADDFGRSVSLSGDVAVVGAPADNINGNPDSLSGNLNYNDGTAGAVYFFERDPETSRWTQIQKVFSPVNEPFKWEGFGNSVSVSGGSAIVGMPSSQNIGQSVPDKTGTVVFLERGPNGWAEVASLGPNDTSIPITSLGRQVSISGDNAVAASSGWVYFYRRDGSGVWSEVQRVGCDFYCFTYNDFGQSAAISGDVAIVGQPGNSSGFQRVGTAYIFRRNASTGLWSKEGLSLTASDGTANDRFGSTVSISGDVAFVGARDAGGVGVGAVYIFRRNSQTGTWGPPLPSNPTNLLTETQKLTVPVSSVSVSGGLAVVSSYGSTSIYKYSAGLGLWTLSEQVGAQGEDAFFVSSVAGDGVIVGADRVDEFNTSQYEGSVYVTRRAIDRVIAPPADVVATDGTFDSRVQLTWNDRGSGEDGFRVYRDGGLIAELQANEEAYSDFDIAPGVIAEYCVAAFREDLLDTERVCDFGFRPPDGSISGRIGALALAAASPDVEAATTGESESPVSELALQVGATVDQIASASAQEDVSICIEPNPNRALRFDGTGGHVSVRHVPPTDQMTACAWIKTTVGTADLMTWARNDGSDVVFWKVQDGRLSYGEIEGSSFNQIFSTTSVSTGKWVHVCVVRDGTTATLYVDGEQRGTASGFGFPVSTSTLTIGAAERLNQVGAFFDGTIDEVQLWDTALDAPSIQANMSKALSGREPNLIGYWPFDQVAGRLAKDGSRGGNHGRLTDGVYWVTGAFETCTVAGGDGNYTIDQLLYRESTTFTVTPTQPGRSFEPASREITLKPEQPTENQVDFVDKSQYAISGILHFQGTECPVPDVEITVDGEFRASSASDGTYSASVFPSNSPTDLRRVAARFSNPQNPSDKWVFQPQRRDLFVDADTFGVDFVSTKTRFLRGSYGGSCDVAGDLGAASVRVFTEDGCFDQTLSVREAFEIELPPQKYLVQAMPDAASAPPGLLADMVTFFDELGAREVDLTLADDTLDFIYRPEIEVEIVGLTPPTQCTELTAGDRTLPLVPIIGRGELVPLTIRVSENYGSGSCPVDKGTVQIFDAIADSIESPRTLQIENGEVFYSTYGASPNIFSGAFVEGMDRSFQKPITAIASVEGRESTSVTEWAIVEGLRVRTAEFVSATTDPFPIMILRDPPGSNSYAFIEKEAEVCTNLSHMQVTGGNAGFNLDTTIGLYTETGFSLGAHITTEFGVGIILRSRTKAGRENGTGGSFEICMSNSERWATSADATWVGEDLFMGVALNLVFARADELKVNTCNVAVSEKLAADLDPQSAFETTYVYGGTHIKQSLIPALEQLIDIAGDETLSGDPDGDGRDDSVSLTQALANWRRQLAIEDSLASAALDGEVENISFSAGAEYGYTHKASEANTSKESTRIHVSSENEIGLAVVTGFPGELSATFDVNSEWTWEKDSTNAATQAVGYVLSDGDTGDFFSVDVGEDPRYLTPVFGTVAGRSSNPWEANTQRRDWPILDINPPIRRGVPADESTTFTMTLTNASESKERREYTVHIVKQQNPGSAFMSFTGDPIDGDLFLVDGGKSQEITLQVERGPSRYAYENLALIAYPEKEYEIWQADPRQPFVMGDTAFYSVYFDAPCSDISVLRPKDLWRLNSASWSDSLDVILSGFDLGGSDAFSVESIGLQYRLAGSSDWLPATRIPINRTDPLEADSLDADASSWFVRWQPPREGAYEIRAFSECTNDQLFSDVVTGSVDTKSPRLLGPPEPSDEVLALGSAISTTFNEPIDCESISTSGAFQNTKLRFVTGPSATPADGAGVGGIDAVCNGETIVIEPPDTFDWTAAEGQIMEARLVSGLEDAQGKSQVIEDLAGNPIANDIAWQFTVRRSAFTWSPADLTVNVDLGSNAEFDAQLVNGRVRLVEYALNGVPGWLSASPPEGTVAPADASAVSFLVTDTLAIGQYTATILAENDGLPARLNLTVDVSCPSPGWTLDPSRFSYSMNLTAALSIDGIPSTDTDDRLGAFVGDELRGTGTANATGIVQMTIYSPLPAGETVTFRALDASACRLYPATDLILPFVHGTSQGNPGSPIAIDAMNNAPQQSVALAKGWTWFSINRTPSSSDPDDVLATLAPSNSDVLKSQTAFSLYDGATRSWIGALNEVNPGTGYMVKLSGPNSLVVSGTPVDVLGSPINVTPGWNWIGYHPQGSQSVDDALGSLTNPDISDLVKSQYGFAQWDGSNWIGSLQTMDPGLGYMIKRANAGTIVYPEVAAGPAVRIAPNRPVVSDAALARLGKEEALKEDEAGQIDDGAIDLSFKRTSQPARTENEPGLRKLTRDFERAAFNMTITADVQIDDQPANRPVFVGAFVDDEPRGLARATFVESLDAYRVFLMVYSDAPDGETVTFRVLDDETDRFFDLNQTTTFEADAVLGSPVEPVVLDNRASGKLVDTEELPTEFALRQNYPNPFNPTTTIKYDVPAQSDVRIVLYDVLGRVVQRLVDRNQKAGRYEVVFDASRIASGTYFYRMQAGDFQALHKMIVIK